MKCALVLAGHGSHISHRTAELVWAHVDKLRALGVADEVTAAFWKEQPSFREALGTLSAPDVTVIPMFTAQGYFTRTVIPAEMGLDGAITRQGGRTIRYARTLSEHPSLAAVVRSRVEAALARVKIGHDSGDEVGVVIVGHSTRRAPESRLAAVQQAGLIRESGLVREVVTVFLDDDPAIPEAFALTTAPTLIVVPFFLAAGSHTTLDVPRQIGLNPGQDEAVIQGRRVIYTAPVGVEQSLTAAILELAREAGALLHAGEERLAEAVWEGFPAAGHDMLIEAVARTGTLSFGQLELRPEAVQPLSSAGGTPQRLESPDALRAWIRQPAQGFRPLATRTDLPGGWIVRCNQPEHLHAVVETVYPGAVAAWAAMRRGAFMPGSLAALCQRQTGQFRHLAQLDSAEQTAIVTEVCAGCVLRPVWHTGALEGIPCAEPCNFWLSRAFERHKPEEESS